MKIMHVGQMIGGLDVYIRNAVTYCPNKDIEFVVVHGLKDKHAPIVKEGIKVKEYGIHLYRSLNPYLDLKGFLQLLRLIKKEKPDIIHCHSAKGGMLGRIAGWMTRRKTFYTPHAFSFLSARSRAKRAIYKLLERATKLDTCLLACSESEREMGISEVKYRKKHALVWHNSVPDADISAPGNANPPFICYVGRPCYQKNTLLLIDIIRKVKDKGSDIKFMLLGIGYHSPDLEAMKRKILSLNVSDQIILKPWLSHKDCLEYVKQAAFYLTTSRYEGLPLSVIEAMSLGKAIIASDVAGNRDCVTDKVNGFLLPLNADIFAERIIELCNDEGLREKYGAASRSIFLNDFLIDKQIDKLYDIYSGS